ncbi:hypothetical protein HK097_010314 [Rhizophlyctis rosea]|uniref:USP domain-containing protein n=1 Tax=Rhizophlyctis rosea TaxID=64517 RepID=A0AAD5S992_9FUNG|nr:hypothetical protein HK097_010314 [Rhizophlyctis rosea]
MPAPDLPTTPAEKRKTSPLEEETNTDTPNVDSEEDSDSDVAPPPAKRGRIAQEQDTGPAGLFLDTVNRYMLDFDFEKLCSVSLSNLNVYACLVYILPDGYEVTDSSLNDIKYVLQPTFTSEQVANLDKHLPQAYDLNNKAYMPGFVGLNNIKQNDYVNVIIQSLAHITPLRNYFLLDRSENGSELVKRFGTLIRKIWNTRAFKGQVSPHELLQEISNSSQKRFRLSEQADVIDFLSWFLNALHLGMGGTRKKSSVIHDIFQGEVKVESQTIIVREDEQGKRKVFDESREITTKRSPFMFLTLDLPPPPLFQDEAEKNIIPQIALTTLLSKYDGVTGQESGSTLRRYKITKLPRYLVFHIKRFTKNNWAQEKNPTIVNFPIKNVDMRDYVEGVDPDAPTKYDLVANIIHEGGSRSIEGNYKVHVHCKAKDQWLQIQDLFVEEIMPQMIFLSESYLQVWERKDDA